MRAAWIGLGAIGLAASCVFLWTESRPRGEADDGVAPAVAASPLMVVRPTVGPPPPGP